jgi:hypothetical protein
MTTTTSRRAMLAGAAMLPAVSLPALAAPAFASDAFGPDHPDSELLRLGAELEQVEQEWLAQSRIDRRHRAAHFAAIEAAGLPNKNAIDFDGLDEMMAYHEKQKAVWYEGKEEDEADPDLTWWSSFNDRLRLMLDEIIALKPHTLAGLAVFTRAIALSHYEYWTEDGGAREYIETVSSFLGITPAPIVLEGEA